MKRPSEKKRFRDNASVVHAQGIYQSSTASKLFSEGRSLFLIVSSTILVYGNSLSGAFVFDDTKQIAGNPELHEWQNLFRAFEHVREVFVAGAEVMRAEALRRPEVAAFDLRIAIVALFRRRAAVAERRESRDAALARDDH